MKILHIINTGNFSGAENVAITIIDNYSDNINGIYMSRYGNIACYLKEKNIPYYSVDRLSVSKIRKALKEINPDIIHAHDFTASVLTALTGTKIRIVFHIHNNSPWIRRKNLKSYAFMIACHRADMILTVSESVMKEYIFGKRFANKTRVIGNPINIRLIREKINVSEKRHIYDVAFFGRISPPKNPYLFIEIIKELKKEIENIKAVMIGDGELRNAVEEKIAEYGLKENIHLTGFLKEPYPVLNSAKLLCMPSSWEGYGLAAVEALALGLPVVASSAGGLPQIVNEDCGKVCSVIEEYVKEIHFLLKDHNSYMIKSRNALCRSNTLNNINEYMRNLVKLYIDVKE